MNNNNNNRWASVFDDDTRFQCPALSQQLPLSRIEPAMVSGEDSRDSGYSSSSSNSSIAYMDICIDNAMEEYYRKLVSIERRLVLETTYPLNCITKVVIGSSPARDFSPIIKLTRDGSIVGSIVEEPSDGKRSIDIPIEEWNPIIDYFTKSAKFLNDDDDDDVQPLESQTIFEFTLTPQIFLDRKCIKIETCAVSDDAQCLYLRADGVLALINLKPIIDSHLCRIKQLGLHEVYNKTLQLVTKMTTDYSISERFKMLSNLLEPAAKMAMLEVARFHTSKLHNDYERIKA